MKRKSNEAFVRVETRPGGGGVGSPAARREKPRRPESTPPTAGQSWMSAAAIRELVESVVVAFVLAFLFRTFEAEAFVIPTGSMAPTLMGRHRDVHCAKCGYPYQINASSEVEQPTNRLTNNEVVSGTCPMCRFPMDIGPGNPQGKSYPSYPGDRIIVTKFPYQFGDPERFDVAVFKYPGGAKTNYIKRIVGIPNETVIIRHGDLLIRPDGQQEPVIVQKPADKILAMMQPVYDNDYVVPELVLQGMPPRWTPSSPPAGRPDAWKPSEDGKSFRVNGNAPGEAWLHYQHRVPCYSHWQRLLSGGRLSPESIPPQLITDFAPYNTERNRMEPVDSWRQALDRSSHVLGMGKSVGHQKLGLHWVGDLLLECSVTADQGSGQFLMALVKAGVVFRCEIDLATGQARLLIDGLPEFRPTAATKCRGPGTHRVRFANFDQKLWLWVDGSLAQFDATTSYWPLDDSRPEAVDLEPARVGSRQAALRVSHLKLFRDIYYIAERGASTMCDYDPSPGEFPHFYGSDDFEEKFIEFFSSPGHWDVFRRRRQVEFHLGKDQYLALGDNSAQSLDSRLWEQRGPQYHVDRNLLIGKALFVYWPHSWNTIPGTRGLPGFPDGVWFPFFPNFARMGSVR